MSTSWTIAIDWDRNGDFSGEHDDITQRVLYAEWFVGMQRPYQLTADGSTLVMRLNNADRRFSPENSAGPLSGKLVPLRPVKIESHAGTTTRTHWSGWIAMILPFGGKKGNRQVDIIAHGAMQFLKATETKIELQENQRSDQIIDALVSEVIFPPALADAWVIGDPDYSKLGQSTKLANLEAYSDYEDGLLTLNMVGDNWVRQGGYSDQAKDTFDVYPGIRDITAAERGKFFFDRDGKAVFWNRHHILDKDDIDASFDDAMTDMKYTFASLDQTKNEIIVTCHPRSVAAEPTTLWELKDAVIRVAPGATREVYVKYKDEKDKRIGGKDVTVEDVEYLQGQLPVEVEAKANGANLVFKNESDEHRSSGREMPGQGPQDRG